jgi:diadenosine tetraphosphatase ApaH/serine/threonine PP2A family protein phosphatase
MRIGRRRLVLAFALAMALALPAVAGTERIVAVGDVHGNFEGLTAILQEAGIIDENLKWAGGDATYIQLGDLFDRGLKVREVADLIMRLQAEAAAAGGRVECILGNHETMNLTGFYRDANPEIYATFIDRKSEKRRKKVWSAVKDYLELWKKPPDDEAKQAWMAEHPLGWVEYARALGPKGVYGEWLRTLPAAVMIDGVLFIHGGVSPEVAGRTVDEINAAVRKELRTFDKGRQYLVSQSLLPQTASFTEVGEFVRLLIFEAEKETSTDKVRRHAEQLKPLAGIDSWLTMSPEGPLWFRGAARWDEELRGEEMAALLDGIGAQTMVVGHTPDPDGTIRVRFDNRVFLIDTGMLSSYYPGGRPSALEIEGGVFTAIYLNGEREVLVDDEALDKVALVLPGISELQVASR